jgi:hypothetical protein
VGANRAYKKYLADRTSMFIKRAFHSRTHQLDNEHFSG